MKIIKTHIPDLLIIEPSVFKDERGYFFESFNDSKFVNHKLDYDFIQDNESKSSYGVLRGLHFQTGEYAQAKLVRVVTGKILDVAVDLRKGSPTFCKHFAIELSSENKKQLLVPRGFAHGFAVLSNDTIINYKCDNIYNKDAESGVIFSDSQLNIQWGLTKDEIILSKKDMQLPELKNLNVDFLYKK